MIIQILVLYICYDNVRISNPNEIFLFTIQLCLLILLNLNYFIKSLILWVFFTFAFLCSDGGCFKAHLIFTSEYPLKPPKMKFISEIWHPNSKCKHTVSTLIWSMNNVFCNTYSTFKAFLTKLI